MPQDLQDIAKALVAEGKGILAAGEAVPTLTRRALEDPALEAWHGRHENIIAGQKALYQRARCNGAACLGTYAGGMEEDSNAAGGTHRLGWHDD